MSRSVEDEFNEIALGKTDPYGFYARARSEAPIFWSNTTGGWVAAKHRDVLRVLQDEESFAPLGYGAGSSIIHGRVVLHMEGREHRKKSALSASRIRRPRIIAEEYEPLAERLSEKYLAEVTVGTEVDLKSDFTTPLPLNVTASLMGIPEAPRFRDWYDAIVLAGASNLSGDPEVQRRGLEAKENLVAFLRPVVASRRESPGDDMLSDLCTFEYEGELLSDEEIFAFCSFLLAAGVETTDRALSSLLRYLFTNRDVWELLAADRDLLPAACAEILRYSPPVHAISRGVVGDTEMSGQALEAGQRVLVLLASGNRDEELFDEGEEFVLDRFAESAHQQFTPKADILPFGAGRHHCTGSLLALMEMVVGMNHLLDRIPWAEWTDGVPEEAGYVLRSPEHLRVRVVER